MGAENSKNDKDRCCLDLYGSKSESSNATNELVKKNDDAGPFVKIKETEVRVFVSKINVRESGVLGLATERDGAVVKLHPEPAEDEIFLDTAELRYISGVRPPSTAGDPSGAIYKFLGLDKSECFPDPVQQTVTKPMDAKYHPYSVEGKGIRQCVHVVGPDFRRYPGLDTETAVDMLALAYKHVLCEIAEAADQAKVNSVLLLPVSCGEFADQFSDQMADITFQAIANAFAALSSDTRTAIMSIKSIHVCISLRDQAKDFRSAKARLLQR